MLYTYVEFHVSMYSFGYILITIFLLTDIYRLLGFFAITNNAVITILVYMFIAYLYENFCSLDFLKEPIQGQNF